jgi:hypothetical protein
MRRTPLGALAATAVAASLLTAPAWSGTATASALPEVPARTISLLDVKGWPQKNVLPVYPDNPNDASIIMGVTPYDEIAPKLNQLQAVSDRVSARVAGKSANGLDLYAVVVTAPETDDEARQQERWKREIENEPAKAQNDARLKAGYKTPFFINANIHGNEWEGTDAVLRLIEKWATSTDPAVEQLLERNRIVINVTANPDGRIANTRPNGAGYDLNRDMTIVSQPETVLIRDLVVESQPLFSLDLHGYVNPTLLHPSTPPHNVNNEYDLFIKHGLTNALGIEENLKKLPYEETKAGARIPFRDDAPGVWDDFPPIYVPSFSMLQSSIPYTIEAPLNPRGATLTLAERARRSGINTDVHVVAVETSLQYLQDNREQMLWDQAEVFRRGWAGEPLRDIPDNYVPGWGPEDNYNTTFPRSYVIPAGEDQHSETAAARLVDLIIGSDGRVWRATEDFTAGGKTYEAGSYVIDMHQPKRGLVNSLLEPGADITDRVDDLYAGPGAWSQGLTWGATVDALWEELPATELQRSYDGYATGDLPAGKVDLRLDIQDGADLLALNALLEQDVPAYRLADGSVVIPHSNINRKLAAVQTREEDVTFTAAPAGWTGTLLDEVVVGYIGSVEVRDVLADTGFEARALSAGTLATTLTEDVDVIVVGSNVNVGNLSAENRAALDAFLARGGGVVGLGTAGAGFSNATSLISVTATSGPGLASGVVNVVNSDGPIASGAIPHSWIFPPVWYTNLGTGVEVEQSYATDPLLSGWWGSNDSGSNSQAAAAGQASIVRGVSAGGNGVVLIGTSPVTRLHAKGLHSQFGRALLWAAQR